MVILKVMLMIPVLAFLVGFSLCDAVETVVVEKFFNGGEIKARSGSMIRVELEQAGAAGYTWEIQDLDKKHFEVVSEKTSEPPEKPAFAGGPVKKTWLIRAKKKGKSEFRCMYFRSWEGKENAADAFVLKVSIF